MGEWMDILGQNDVSTSSMGVNKSSYQMNHKATTNILFNVNIHILNLSFYITEIKTDKKRCFHTFQFSYYIFQVFCSGKFQPKLTCATNGVTIAPTLAIPLHEPRPIARIDVGYTCNVKMETQSNVCHLSRLKKLQQYIRSKLYKTVQKHIALLSSPIDIVIDMNSKLEITWANLWPCQN